MQQPVYTIDANTGDCDVDTKLVNTTKDNYFLETMANCQDFKNQRSALEEFVIATGHILLMSPKYHPELAGVGIEYVWGKSKLEFRRNINDCVPKHLHENIAKALHADLITIDMCRRFARRSRDYKRIYNKVRHANTGEFKREDNGNVTRKLDGRAGFDLYEKMRKECKLHRCIMHLEESFLNKM